MRCTLTLTAAIVLVAAAATPALAATGDEQLPDLDQEAPAGLVVMRSGHADFALGFDSRVRNVGTGDLRIRGSRPNRHVRRMVADQFVEREGAPARRIRGVGRMRYVVSPDHRHWHVLGFDRYTLRRVGGGAPVRRDRKSGFCLGDRYASTAPAPGAPARYTTQCGRGQPGRMHVSEGISPGYGDLYGAMLEGQYVTLRGLPDGQYELVHRVNANRRLREARYDNNASSVLLNLHWSGGQPYLRVLATCEHSAHCAAPVAAAASASAPAAASASATAPHRVPFGTRRHAPCCCCVLP
jgi:hypothetical protein